MVERYLTELWIIVLNLALPLLLGIAIAGIIHVILPMGFVHRNLGGHGLASIIKATLIGVPMPLCSCGVVPTAIGLKQDGASNGASTSFLISTPQTGVDSILVSASFLGWPFAIFKLAAASVTGIIGGKLVDIFDKKQTYKYTQNTGIDNKRSYKSKIIEAIRFGLFELLGMIYGWIILGIAIAALITIIIPPGTLSDIGWITGVGGMFLMLLIALPLYVCATASVPIAASLIAAGMPAGAALVFLMAGPASNIATVGAILRAFGGRILAIYLTTVAIFSMLFGILFNSVINTKQAIIIHHNPENGWLSLVSGIVLIGLFIYLSIHDLKKKYQKKPSLKKDMGIKLNIIGMTCQHCATNVTNALKNVTGVNSVNVNLEENTAVVDGDVETEKLIESVKKIGYEASVKNN